MKKKSLILFSLFLVTAFNLLAQGRGGAQGRSGAQGQQAGRDQPAGRQSKPQERGAGNQQHARASTRQRDQIRTCDQQADKIRKQMRKMAQTPSQKFNADQARQQWNQLQQQIRAMEQEHERLMNGLDANQQQAWQEEIRNMNRLREQLRTAMQQMNSELGSSNPDPAGVAERAREMEQFMQEWRKQYHALYAQGNP